MKTSVWYCVLVGAMTAACAFPACGSSGSGSGSGGSGGTSSATDPTSSETGGSTPSGGGSNAGGSSAGGSNSAGSSAGGSGAGENPVAHITSPHDGDSFAVNTSFPWTGDASDPQDGVLSGNSLIWKGDIGTIGDPEGVGNSGNASFDSVGDHTLTVTATDSDGNTGEQTITLHITQ
jgi:hypothetical protein